MGAPLYRSNQRCWTQIRESKFTCGVKMNSLRHGWGWYPLTSLFDKNKVLSYCDAVSMVYGFCWFFCLLLLSSRIIAFWHGCLAALFVNNRPYIIICPQLIHLYLALVLVHVMVIDENVYLGALSDECENIHSRISLVGDLAFSHQGGIYGFKFPKRFSGELFPRDLTLFWLFSLFCRSNHLKTWLPNHWCPSSLHSQGSMPCKQQSDILKVYQTQFFA